MSPRLPFPIALAAAVALVAAPVAAQPAGPQRIELSYDGMLNALHLTGDFKVLDLHAVEHATATGFDTTAEMKSYGLLDALMHIHVTAAAAGSVKAGLPLPHLFHYDRIYKGHAHHTAMVWGDDDVGVAPPPHNPGNPPPTKAQKHEAADPLTLFSRAVYAPNGAALCARNWRFFDGSEIYELQFQPGSPTPLSDKARAMGFSREMVCQVHYAEVAGFIHRKGESHDEGLRSAIHAEFGQLGPTGPWLFLSMTADTVLGSARVELTSVKVGPG